MWAVQAGHLDIEVCLVLRSGRSACWPDSLSISSAFDCHLKEETNITFFFDLLACIKLSRPRPQTLQDHLHMLELHAISPVDVYQRPVWLKHGLLYYILY